MKEKNSKEMSSSLTYKTLFYKEKENGKSRSYSSARALQKFYLVAKNLFHIRGTNKLFTKSF